ncbi:hypothetical protein Y032_0373g187 [Ancylostoma ceylanicum]|uniref:Secreted protein n=1 Tax=Ancylostoma ceylanicum TaxID=53326 RepID=A0A016RTX2_9BILA|nr:hypothetical protein Y032_0373g187 [Ancylostoma ceylanicum]
MNSAFSKFCALWFHIFPSAIIGTDCLICSGMLKRGGEFDNNCSGRGPVETMAQCNDWPNEMRGLRSRAGAVRAGRSVLPQTSGSPTAGSRSAYAPGKLIFAVFL